MYRDVPNLERVLNTTSALAFDEWGTLGLPWDANSIEAPSFSQSFTAIVNRRVHMWMKVAFDGIPMGFDCIGIL